MENYQIIDISEVAVDAIEQLGTKSKFWFKLDNKEYLFKSIKTQDNLGNEILRFGEDWAEKIACEIAQFISLPCATYELAICKGIRGVITPNFINPDFEKLITANELLPEFNDLIALIEAEEKGEKQEISRVIAVCEDIIKNKPKGYESQKGVKTALDFMIGYLLLDALISNQDRHSENWGMVESLNEYKTSHHLAPSFDHAASLGRNESEETMNSRLTTKDVGRSIKNYVRKAKTHFYQETKRLKTADVFIYVANIKPEAARYWLERIQGLSNEIIQTIVARVPVEIMSTIQKEFVTEVICSNRDYLLLESLHIINGVDKND
jgi:hypothetical protein